MSATPIRNSRALKNKGLSLDERDQAVRAAILDAAADLFFADGYDIVSVDAIIARVGGSKATIYRHFNDKEGLLNALVDRESANLRKPLDDLDLDGMNMEAALTAIGNTFLSVVYDERAVALHRLVVAQGRRFPALSTTFAAAGPEGSVRTVATIFSDWQGRGWLARSRGAEILARQFLDMLKINGHARLLLGLRKRPAKSECTRIIAEAVETFLYGAAGQPRPKA